MKKFFSIALIMILFCTGTAFAARQYIIPDSDSRLLAREELEEWDKTSIMFIFNEIFARHGYVFKSDGIFYPYFNSRPWYTPNENPDNTKYCYPRLNSIEWENEALCKELLEDIRQDKHYSDEGKKNFLDYVEGGFEVLSGFEYIDMKPNQKLDIYSCPDVYSYRGANGKARLSTNGAVYIAGRENGFILAMYETNKGAVRVGYFKESNSKDKIKTHNLEFRFKDAEIVRKCILTDDPVKFSTKLLRLKQGDSVVYLGNFYNLYGSYAYIESIRNGQIIRGFVRESDLKVNDSYNIN